MKYFKCGYRKRESEFSVHIKYILYKNFNPNLGAKVKLFFNSIKNIYVGLFVCVYYEGIIGLQKKLLCAFEHKTIIF